MHFIAVIEKEPTTVFGGWFHDVPGAASAGATMHECTDSALHSLREWAADARACGDEIPTARTLEQIHADPDVIAARKRGAILIAVPMVVSD